VLIAVETATNLADYGWTTFGVVLTNTGQKGHATLKSASAPIMDPSRFLRLKATEP
jgi:hypothetical protein